MKKRILALDYGQKRIGVAISDALYFTSQIRHFIHNNDWNSVVKQIQDYEKDYTLKEIVLGLPLGLSGKDTEQTKKVRLFRKNLEPCLSTPIVFQDESFTTQTAEKFLIDSGTSRKKRKVKKDSLSAQVILHSYMQEHPCIEDIS